MIIAGTNKLLTFESRKEFISPSKITSTLKKSNWFASLWRRKRLTTCKRHSKLNWIKKRRLWGKSNNISCRIYWGEFKETEKNKWSTGNWTLIDWFKEIRTFWMIFLTNRLLSIEEQRISWNTLWASVKRKPMMKSYSRLKPAVTILNRIPWCHVCSESSTLIKAQSSNQKGMRDLKPCQNLFLNSTTQESTNQATATAPNAPTSA